MKYVNPHDIEDNDILEMFSSARGSHQKTFSLLMCDEFCDEARSFVRSNACVNGKPSLTCKEFADWVDATWKHSICEETARVWLHKLGFRQRRSGEGVYFDGHESEDVVED